MRSQSSKVLLHFCALNLPRWLSQQPSLRNSKDLKQTLALESMI